jgi:hypothetical protein
VPQARKNQVGMLWVKMRRKKTNALRKKRKSHTNFPTLSLLPTKKAATRPKNVSTHNNFPPEFRKYLSITMKQKVTVPRKMATHNYRCSDQHIVRFPRRKTTKRRECIICTLSIRLTTNRTYINVILGQNNPKKTER